MKPVVKISLETKDLIRQLNKLDDEMKKEGLIRILSAGAGIVELKAKMNLDRHGLRKTGNLINSIRMDKVKITGRTAYVLVGSFGVIYNYIHEFGGIIVPKRAKVLHWINEQGEDVFAMKVVIPARPYLRPAVEENINEINNAMQTTFQNFITSKLGVS